MDFRNFKPNCISNEVTTIDSSAVGNNGCIGSRQLNRTILESNLWIIC